jgi:hypothetical protein
MVTVAWNSTTVDTKKPQISSCGPLVPSPGAAVSSQPPSRNSAVASAMGIADRGGVGAESPPGQEPAHVRAEEAVLHRRMQVARQVGMAMVVAMVGGPPQRTALHAHRADHGEHELHRP